MGFGLIVLVTIIYLVASVMLLASKQVPQALMLIGYTIANAGLLMTMIKPDGA